MRIICAVPDRPTITVSFPAAPEYLRLARLATADIASRAGFDYEEIDDLRIGVSELCSMISGAAGATVTLDFTFDDATVRVQGVADPGALMENELSRAIVGAVVDDYEVDVHDGSARFRASKRSQLG
jgi:serine/threonine-protein kinase RsbW